MIDVLLIDDEPEICEIAKLCLIGHGGFAVTTANSVKEARQLMAVHRFDVVVSDYQMPREDGVQLLKSLRSAGNVTPFILFTGKGREELAAEAIGSGADSYLQKGGSVDSAFGELANRIRNVVGPRRPIEQFPGRDR
jgi:DNA-binding response OmpR family regulator